MFQKVQKVESSHNAQTTHLQ